MKSRLSIHCYAKLVAIALLTWHSPVHASETRIVIPGPQTPAIKIAVDRLQEYGGAKADVLQGRIPDNASKRERTIVLGTAKDSPELEREWNRGPAKPDSYLVKTISTKPLVIVASGIDQRGVLYAAYQLADLLRAETDLSAVDIFRQPRVAERYATFGATLNARKWFVPDQHWRTLNEAPAFGYNGIVIYPNAGTPIGRRASPVLERKNGDFYIDEENTREWKQWFARLRDYQLNIMMTIPPAIPPGYSNKQVRDFYGGGPEPEGYIDALQAHFKRFLELLTATYPDLDRYMFNSTEGATFGRNERFFSHPDARFSNASYIKNNEKIMRAYFEVLESFFGAELKRVAYWTHSFGLTSEGIAKMREVLFDYPEVTIIEDDFWNNNLWPFDLPAMAYLPADLRAKVSSNNPFAMYQIATDGEYYGGGTLPNAYPGSHIRTAREAVKRKACMVIQRLDLHDRTTYGTAFGSMKIVPLAASRQLWEPTPPESEIWQEWAASRFGKSAAPHVIRGLQESKTILRSGLSGNGIDLLAVGSEFNPRLWIRDRAGLTRFHLFSKPGRRLVNKSEGDIIYSPEYTAWQMQTETISIGDFRRNQDEARAAVRRGLQQLSQAKPHLEPADYEMLRSVFLEGDIVLKAMRLLGETAYAGNLLLDNFDRAPNPKELFQRAVTELEAFLAEETLKPEMKNNIGKILADYKQINSP